MKGTHRGRPTRAIAADALACVTVLHHDVPAVAIRIDQSAQDRPIYRAHIDG